MLIGFAMKISGQTDSAIHNVLKERMTDQFLLENHEGVIILFDSMMMASSVNPELRSLKQAYLSALELSYEFNLSDSIISLAKRLYPNSFPNSWDTLKLRMPNEKFTIVDEQPEFKGGMAKFYKTVSKILQYPSEARTNGTEGRVYVEFVVSESGEITNIKALQGIGNGCDEEAVRIMENMPNFIPGKQKGKPVRVKMVLPIYFKLAN